jgi:hypothetical protein
MKCDYCEEEILPGERAPNPGSDFHHECLFRMGVGSVGHVNRRCNCYGGNEGDPEGMTRREAARAALELYLKLDTAHIRWNMNRLE